MDQNKATFDKWFARPLRMLETETGGDGAFIALAMSCALYERYAVAVINERGDKADREAKVHQLAVDFAVDLEAAEAFWKVCRDGFLHQAMGLQTTRGDTGLPKWWVDEGFAPIELVSGSPCILRMQPWRIRDRVLDLWYRRPDLLNSSAAFPWATIWTP